VGRMTRNLRVIQTEDFVGKLIEREETN